MVLNAEKRNKFVELVARRKAALANAGTSTLVNTPPAKGCFFGSVVGPHNSRNLLCPGPFGLLQPSLQTSEQNLVGRLDLPVCLGVFN